jgi:hypothetical protein
VPDQPTIDLPDKSTPPLLAWGSAVITVASLLNSGTVAFCRVEGRCDLADQKIENVRADDEKSIATLKGEGEELRRQRDLQAATITVRIETLERGYGEMNHALNDLSARLAVMEARQTDTLDLLHKIDARVSGSGPGPGNNR